MKTYKTTQKPLENRIVRELNASVLTNTFKNKSGVQKADLYSVIGGCDKIVCHNTCSPVNATFKETILISF